MNRTEAFEFVARGLRPGDAGRVAELVTAGRYLCGTQADLQSALTGLARSAGSVGVFLLTARGAPVAAVAVRSEGRLVPRFRVAVTVGGAGGAAAEAAFGAAVAQVRTKIGAVTRRSWLTADAPDSDPATEARMRATGWTETQTVRGGARRYVMSIRGTEDDPTEPAPE